MGWSGTCSRLGLTLLTPRALGFEQPVHAAPKQGALLLAPPQLLLFLKGGQLLAKDAVNTLECGLGDVTIVNHPQHMTLSAGWTKDGETDGPGGGVGRKPRLGCMRVQVALGKVKVKLEWTVPVQDRIENPLIIVGCVSWYL